MVNIVHLEVFAMTILGKITNKKALTIYTIAGAAILLSAILISPVAYTWAQYQQQLAGNNTANLYTHKQFINKYECTIPKING